MIPLTVRVFKSRSRIDDFPGLRFRPETIPMKLTRRRFLECTGAVVAGTGLGPPVLAAGQSQPARPIAGAPGVELNVGGAVLPDYSHDLERYLVRLANEARE